MNTTVYNHVVKTKNLFSVFTILDLKHNVNYINISNNNTHRTFFISNRVFVFPFLYMIYLYSNKKNILNMYKTLINSTLHTYCFEYKLHLDFIGTGYRVFNKDKYLFFILGYSHLIKVKLPDKCTWEISNNGKMLSLKYHNKYVLGNIVFIIKSFKRLNIYKGKGIKNIYDQIKLKLGKTKSIKK